MSGRILIIDSVATNRIVLKAKVLAAQYDVVTCATCEEAGQIMQGHAPDLLLINLSDPIEDRHAFCRSLRGDPKLAHIPIISVGIADTVRARFAALDSGADDVLPRPLSDVLLLARIRNLLRRRHVSQDLQLRDGTSRALGFDEAGAQPLTPARITILSENYVVGQRLLIDLKGAFGQRVRQMTSHMARATGTGIAAPDLFVIDGAGPAASAEHLYQLVSDLNTRVDTRLASQMVIVPKDRPDMAAMVLDLGASDVVFEDVSPQELTLRIQHMIVQKSRQDRLRDRVRNGLNAAVTDPLTGLYNRRYAEAQLECIAEKARETGTTYALMILDIDHFKSINDRYGHVAGDLVLGQLADVLRDSFRGIDLVARIGGEEFLVAMPTSTAEEAEMAAERVRLKVNARPFAIGEFGPDLQISISVGVAVESGLPKSVTRLAALFAQADAALYDAKSAGRNTIVMSQFAA